MAATLFETEIAVANFRMLFVGYDNIGILHQQRLNVISGLSNNEFWLIFRNLNYEAKNIEEVVTIETLNTKRNHLNLNG